MSGYIINGLVILAVNLLVLAIEIAIRIAFWRKGKRRRARKGGGAAKAKRGDGK